MYITLRKYRVNGSYEDLRKAVETGLMPILKASPGFQAHWLMKCNDDDVAGLTLFDTKEHAEAALEKTLGWVANYARQVLVLPPNAMFGAEVEWFV